MSERQFDSMREREQLDRHITGNYGEDSVPKQRRAATSERISKAEKQNAATVVKKFLQDRDTLVEEDGGRIYIITDADIKKLLCQLNDSERRKGGSKDEI